MLERRLEYEQRQSAREQVLAADRPPRPLGAAAGSAAAPGARTLWPARSWKCSEPACPRTKFAAGNACCNRTSCGAPPWRLKEHFVLQKIAEVEKIDINEDDIDDEIERIADQDNESPRRVRARLEKEDLIEALAAQIIERKALDLILESAEYEDVPAGAADRERSATVEEQAVQGEMKDPTAPPAEEQAAKPRPASDPAGEPTPERLATNRSHLAMKSCSNVQLCRSSRRLSVTAITPGSGR